MKNAVFWDVTSCGSCESRRFGGTYRLHYQGDKNRHARNININEQPKNAAEKPHGVNT
jgi:positive regulator of sigma E activity